MVDTTKWSEIYKKHSKKMLWVCKRYVNDLSLAEDLMHEGFITAMQKQHTFTGFGSFEGWLRTIMVNTSLLYLRKNKDRFLVSDSDISDNSTPISEMSATYDIKSKILNTDFTQQELLEVVEAIPEHHRIVFNMYVIDNFSHNQISKTLNITTNTSKSHLLRARKKIQQLLFLKANEKEEKKDRKKLFFWFFFFSGYIDSLYAKGNPSSGHAPSKPFDIEGYIKQNNLPDSITSGYLFGVSLQKITAGIAAVLTILLSLFYFNTEKINVRNKIENDETSVTQKQSGSVQTNSDPKQKDSLKVKRTVNSQNVENQQVANPQKANTTKPISQETSDKAKKRIRKKKAGAPVVIKKIIDTVYVYK